eukprot:4114087-Pleurochrysis_carterae.AAC.3
MKLKKGKERPTQRRGEPTEVPTFGSAKERTTCKCKAVCEKESQSQALPALLKGYEHPGTTYNSAQAQICLATKGRRASEMDGL